LDFTLLQISLFYQRTTRKKDCIEPKNTSIGQRNNGEVLSGQTSLVLPLKAMMAEQELYEKLVRDTLQAMLSLQPNGKGQRRDLAFLWADDFAPLVVVEETVNQDRYIDILTENFANPILIYKKRINAQPFRFHKYSASEKVFAIF
jgi:hypothetical protein